MFLFRLVGLAHHFFERELGEIRREWLAPVERHVKSLILDYVPEIVMAKGDVGSLAFKKYDLRYLLQRHVVFNPTSPHVKDQLLFSAPPKTGSANSKIPINLKFNLIL